MTATLRAEWTKLRTARSTFWALLAFVGVSLLFSVLACWESETMGGGPGRPGDNDIVLDSLAGVWFGQIAAIVLAVLAVTSEYATGLVRTTFTAMPRRRTVLAVKALVVGGILLLVGTATSVACFVAGQEILQTNGFVSENGYPAETLRDGDTARAVLGTGAIIALVGLFAIGVGAALRHTAGALTLVLAVVLAPVIAIGFLPESLAHHIEKVALMGGGLALQQTVDRPDNISLGPWVGLGVVGLYALAAVVAALVLIGRRDA